ncbi:DUF4153 domain-containing protein [Lysobacter pythonis]|uniref:DUF4153 domain-containing protein n=1 Tax=Solilutibacter pythonis TaxID=2483112 RepID=A0A3M2HZ67_9GAMM|nr:DUF4153 domain-containing protein [Lysobacter pythonis]RMH93143.1 DUF4153 domain-containing protein [Lysobacter pythonis]
MSRAGTTEPGGTALESERLPREVRQFIVLLAMSQGLLLYFASTGQDQGWWPFSELHGCVYWYTLVLSVPTAMLLSVRALGERRFWWQSALLALVFSTCAGWAAWSATGASGIRAGEVLWPFGLSMAAALFVALPYLQTALRHGYWNARYPDLFEFAWQNALTLMLTALFTGICWLVLMLWAELFRLIGIGFFRELFREEAFAYLATGLMVGLGILIGRTQRRPVQVARRILFAIFTGLLPLLALIALLFVASLPFTGLEPLWKTRSAAAILMSLVVVMVLFANAVYQDGDDPLPYPRGLRRVVDAGLLTLPVFAVLALYAMALRIGQYGWTQERLAGVIAASILAGHAFGYAWAVLRPRGGWLSVLKPVNVVVSLAAMALALLVNSPVLDPHRIAVASQLARLADGRIAREDFDLAHLRFDSGRLGYRAVEALGGGTAAADDTRFARRIQAILQRKDRWRSEADLKANAIRDPARLRAVVAIAPGTGPVEDGWWSRMVAADFALPACVQADADCVLIGRDLDGDGREDRLLCGLGVENWQLECRLYDRASGQWRYAGEFSFSAPEKEAAKVRQALRRGEIAPHRQRWPALEAGGLRRRMTERCQPGEATPNGCE